MYYSRWERMILVFAIVAPLGYCIYLVQVFFGSDIDRFVNARSFDSAVWKNQDAVMSSPGREAGGGWAGCSGYILSIRRIEKDRNRLLIGGEEVTL